MDVISLNVSNLKNGDVLRYNRLILVEGLVEYNNDTLITAYSTTPIAYTAGSITDQGFVRGDLSYRFTPAAGVLADACTVAGNPGTWAVV